MKKIDKRGSQTAWMWCVRFPDGRIMNADTAHTARYRRQPGLYATRKHAKSAIAQRARMDGARPHRIEITASWKVLP